MEHDGLNDHERVRVRASTRETAQNAPFVLALRNDLEGQFDRTYSFFLGSPDHTSPNSGKIP